MRVLKQNTHYTLVYPSPRTSLSYLEEFMSNTWECVYLNDEDVFVAKPKHDGMTHLDADSFIQLRYDHPYIRFYLFGIEMPFRIDEYVKMTEDGPMFIGKFYHESFLFTFVEKKC